MSPILSSASGPIVTTTNTEKHLDEANTTWNGPPCETIAWSVAVSLFVAAAALKLCGKGN
mgnify:CR=1 FL=1